MKPKATSSVSHVNPLCRPRPVAPPPTATTRNLLRLMKDPPDRKKKKPPTMASVGMDSVSNTTDTAVRNIEPVKGCGTHATLSLGTMNLGSKKPTNVDIFGTVPTKRIATNEAKPPSTTSKGPHDVPKPMTKRKKRKLDVEMCSVESKVGTLRKSDDPLRETSLLPIEEERLKTSEPKASVNESSVFRNNLYCGIKKRKPLRIVQQQNRNLIPLTMDTNTPPMETAVDCLDAGVHVLNHRDDETPTATAASAVDLPAVHQPSVAMGITEAVSCSNVGVSKSTPRINPYTNAATQFIPRPAVSKSNPAKTKKDNYIRLNLRNKAGACLGARNVRTKSKSKLQWEQRRKDQLEHYQALQQDEDENHERSSSSGTPTASTDAMVNRLIGKSTTSAVSSSGVDVVDDFIDGVLAAAPVVAKKCAKSPLPLCTGHQQPCKLLTVKKSGPNRGRQFYACACPRMEQCNHFAWVDDSLHAAQDALLKNQSISGFIARRVSSYMEQIHCLTVPELKQLAVQHRLDSSGSKLQLRTRLSVWVRDEVAKGAIDLGTAPTSDLETETPASEMEEALDDDTSSSEDELELTGELPSDRFMFLSSGPNKLPSSCDKKRSITDSVLDGIESSECTEPSNIEDPANVVKSAIHTTLKAVFGYDSLRDGQEWAIHRCLNRQRSLLVAPTGFGKSLCYALPAAMMDGVCIVVSPLLSLIQDQIRMIPARLASVTLSGPMSTAATAATLDDIVRGRIKLLFVSPERLTSASFRRLFRKIWNSKTNQLERFFPPVSLLCVDEAHCMSQWAHNFRPSYLRLGSIMEIIEPRSVLAITATAGPRVINDICQTLHIENIPNEHHNALDGQLASCGVRVSKTNRDNIDVKCLFLDSQEERLSALLTILGQDKKFSKPSLPQFLGGCLASGSVIVYTWRQQDAEVVAENIQSSDVTGGVVVYHGGMDASARAKAQSKFMRGKARICVATIAFGLGINKADVAGIIHLYLSSSPEHYIQEIGRAGRDGRSAQAISLILKDEVFVRHSLAHSDLISRSQVKALISELDRQVESSLLSLSQDRMTQFVVNVSFQLAKSILDCDCKVETAETILSLLEERNGKEPLLLIQGTSYDCATVAPKRCILENLALKEPVAKAILQCSDYIEPPVGQIVDKSNGSYDGGRPNLPTQIFGSYSFSIAKCSNYLGDAAEPRHVFAALRRLESNGDIDFALATAPKDRVLSLRLTNEGMKYFGKGNYDLIESLVNETFKRFVSTVSACSNKVLDIHHILWKVFEVSQSDLGNATSKKSASLLVFQQLIENYFEAEGSGNVLATEALHLPSFMADSSDRELLSDVEIVLSHLHNIQQSSEQRLVHLASIGSMDYSVLMITKFLHGLTLPSIPLQLVRNHYLFGKMQGMKFSKLHDAVGRLFVSKREAPNRLLC